MFVANTENDLTAASGTASLLTGSNWSLNHVPTVSEDATYTGTTTGIRAMSAGNLTVGSFNVTGSSGTFSIRNNTSTATDSTLTVGGSGDLGNGVSGTSSTDLLFVANGATFALRGDNGGGGTGVLKVVLGQSGNFDAVGSMSSTAVISDGGSAFGITKTGAGTLTLSAANNYTGATTISVGTLTCGAASVIPSGSSLNLNGGTLKSGATTGNTQSTGTLTLSDNSTIALGTGSHSLTFAASNGVSWTAAKTLTITGWTGGYNGTSGTAGKIFVGSSSSGLTASQLSEIVFFNGTSNFPATILSTGEVVPNLAPPSISKSFGTSPINVGGTSLLTVTVTNPNSSTPLTGVGFTDTLPTGLVFPANLSTGQCGGTATVTGLNTLTLSGASVSAGLPCTTTLSVTADGTATGVLTNNTSTVTSTNGGTGNSASANITVNTVAPTTQTSNLTFSSVQAYQMGVSWTNGNGSNRFVKINTANSFTNPTDGSDPAAANTVYAGSGEQVVYSGTGTSVTVTGLLPGTTYFFRAYEYNGSAASAKYLTTTATNNPRSQATTTLKYQSLQSGDWSDFHTWQVNAGGGFVNAIAGQTPTSADDTIEIQSPHVVTVTAPVTVDQVTVDSGGTLAVSAALTNGGAMTMNGTLQFNSGGTLIGTAPTYDFNSLLKYNTGGSGGRGPEWTPGATSGAGVPGKVQISNNTTFDLPNGTTASTYKAQQTLTIDSGSSFSMGAMTQALTIQQLDNSGTMTLSTVAGGDFNCGGSFTNNGTFNHNDRTTTFSGSGGIFPIGGDITFGSVVNNATLTQWATNINIKGNWTNNANFVSNSRTVTFNGANNTQTIAGSTSFKNLTINHTGSNGVTAAGSTLTVTGLFHLVSGSFTSATQYADVTIDANTTLVLSGDILVSGNWTNNGSFTPGGFTVTFNGTGAQTITTGGTGTGKVFAGFAVNKTSGVATLAGDLSDSTLTINAGTFDQGASFNVSTGAVNVTGGTWSNTGTGDLTLSGDVANAGTITFNGGGTGCPDGDSIAITSTAGQRAWSGAGTFNLTDVAVSNQGGTAVITVHSGTNTTGNGLNWIFIAGCSGGQYTWTGASIATPTDWTVPTNWSPTRATTDPGDVLIFDNNSSPTVTNIPTQTISRLRIIGTTSPQFSAGANGNVLTIDAGTGQLGFDVFGLSVTGSNALVIQLGSGTLGTVTNFMTVAGGAHKLVSNDAGGITIPSGSIFSTQTGFSDFPFGDGDPGQGAAGSVIFQSGASYIHNAGSSPFGAAGNASIVTFQTGSTAQYLTSSGFDANGRTYANLTIGSGSIQVLASNSGTGDFTFDNLIVNSTASLSSKLEFVGSGGSTVKIRGDITSNGVGAGSAPDVFLTAGTGGIVINKTGGGVLTLGNDGSNARSIDFESNAHVAFGTTLSLKRILQMGLGANNTLIVDTAAGIDHGDADGYVIGNLKQGFSSGAGNIGMVYPVGTINGYSPVNFIYHIATFGSYDQTVKAIQAQHASVPGSHTLQRYWTLSSLNGQPATSDVTFHYLAGDVVGTEANYKIIKSSGGTLTAFNPSNLNTGTHTATLNGVTSFSDWTLGETSTVTSINRATATPTNAANVTWQVVFADAINGLTASNLTLANAGLVTPGINTVTATSGPPTTTWNVTASTGTGDGTLGLNMTGSTGLTHTITNLPFTGEVYTIDRTAPSTTSFARFNPATSSTSADTLVFRATFSEDVINVDTTDFAVNGTTTATVTNVSGSGSVYDVTVSGGDLAGFNGTVGLNFNSGENITDTAGNALPNTEPATDETYSVTNPPATLVVNTTADTDDGFCSTDPGGCTLREAINAANFANDASTINFNIPNTELGCVGSVCTITLGSTLPAIQTAATAGAVIIDGGGVIKISGNNLVRPFFVNSGADLTLQNLTVKNGRISNGNGGAIDNEGGTVNIDHSTFQGNNVLDPGNGGAIWSAAGGKVNIANSTFTANAAPSSGAIRNFSGTMTVANSTFSNNQAITFAGGAIENSDTLAVTNSTFSTNSAGVGYGGGAIYNSGTATFKNSIFTDSTQGNCSGPNAITDGGGNLRWPVADTACPGTIPFGDPKLGALADNGGSTQTMALGVASAAIDAGVNMATVRDAVDSSTQNITINESTSIFPVPSVGTSGKFLIQIDGERMVVQQRVDANTLLVTRGANGSTATTHATGAAINPAFDQRGTGFSRKVDGNRDGTAAVDIGAFEAPTCTPPATPSASNGGPYCEGATIQLSTDTVSGATYAWTGPNGFTSALQNPTRANAAIADAGTYSVTVTVDGCTSDAGTTNVVVNPIPATPTANNGGPYCAGATIGLTTPFVSGANYAWTGPNGFTSSQQNPTRSNATTADAGTYSVTITVNGCTSAAGATNVAVNPIPATPTASNGGPYCAGATISLSTPTVAGATYAWTGPNGFTSALQNPTRANATTADAGTYSITITVNGCTSAAGTTNVVVNPTPATPTASNGGPYCAGGTISLSTPFISGATYAWTGPNGFTSSQQNPTRSNATTADAGTYSVTITVNGCTSAAGTTNVVVNPIPATPTASNGGPYCAGATISLSTPTVAGATYAWTGPNGFTSALQNPTRTNATTADAGTYSLTVTVNGCTSAAGTTNVVVNPTPATPTASNGGPY